MKTSEAIQELEQEVRKQGIKESLENDDTMRKVLRKRKIVLQDKLKLFRKWFGGAIETADKKN